MMQPECKAPGRGDGAGAGEATAQAPSVAQEHGTEPCVVCGRPGVGEPGKFDIPIGADMVRITLPLCVPCEAKSWPRGALFVPLMFRAMQEAKMLTGPARGSA